MTTAPPTISPSLPPPGGFFLRSQVDLDEWPAKLRRYRLGLGLYIASVIMLFVGFSSAYIVRRGIPTYEAATGTYSASWEPLQLPLTLLLLNTVLLAGASAAIEIARRKRPGLGWLALCLFLSVGFVVGQGIVWHRLRLDGRFMQSGARTAFFYILTGTHAFHAILGVALVCWIALRLRHWQPVRRYVAIDLSAWYLHSMTVLWIYLFCFLLWA